MNLSRKKGFLQLFVSFMMAGFTALAFSILSSGTAEAQSVPRNMNFYDGTGTTRYNSTGRAFVGNVSGNIDGKIRDGSLTELHVNLYPDNEGPNRLKSLNIYYKPSNSLIRPTLRWYNYGSSQRLVITNVPARQYFRGTAYSSQGIARVEITFINGAPGKAVVSYTHSTYSAPPPSYVRYYNGTVFSGSPLSGRRLAFTFF